MEVKTGIPTKYHHCQFRSRLEAKWATFFDLVDWKWEYEPFDLNGWIPDFLLIGAKEQVLVEVKPHVTFNQFDTDKILNAMMGTHTWENDILLLGCTVFPEYASIGWLGEYELTHFDSSDSTPHIFERAILTTFIDRLHEVHWGLCHECNSFHDRMSGDHPGARLDADPLNVQYLWRTAGNNVQWTPTKDIQP